MMVCRGLHYDIIYSFVSILWNTCIRYIHALLLALSPVFSLWRARSPRGFMQRLVLVRDVFPECCDCDLTTLNLPTTVLTDVGKSSESKTGPIFFSLSPWCQPGRCFSVTSITAIEQLIAAAICLVSWMVKSMVWSSLVTLSGDNHILLANQAWAGLQQLRLQG